MRIDRVYTKAGDKGETSLIGGERVSKADPRLDCYGTVDELNATLGLVRTALATSAAGAHLLPIITRVQNELFNLGTELGAADPARRAKLPRIEQRHIDGLERDIDAVNDDLPVLTSFVLPGGGAASSAFHLARTVCRRAERLVVALAKAEDIGGELPLSYLNRLSDALFVWGRWCAFKDGQPEPLWELAPDVTYRDHPLACPRCKITLARTGATDRWACASCHGQLWSEGEVMTQLLAVAPDLAPDGVPSLPTWSRRTTATPTPCSVCRAAMDPVFLGGVEVDRCRADELFWFDPTEIDRVLEVAQAQHAERDQRGIFQVLRRLLLGS